MCYFMICECIAFEMCQVKVVEMPYACIVHTHTHISGCKCHVVNFDLHILSISITINFALWRAANILFNISLKPKIQIWCQRFSLQYLTLAAASIEIRCSLFNWLIGYIIPFVGKSPISGYDFDKKQMDLFE